MKTIDELICCLRVAHQLQNLRLDGHVQGGGGLVRDQHRRLAGQRHRDHHPLSQAAAELERILADPLLVVRHPDLPEQARAPP